MDRFSIFLAISILIIGEAAWAQQIQPKELQALVELAFGPSVKTASDGKDAHLPRYLRAHLNDDNAEDIVIPIHVDKAKGTLDRRGIKTIKIGEAHTIDASIGKNCLGLAFLHSASKARPLKSSAAHMAYECFSGYTTVKAGAQMLTSAEIPVRNDAILLDLESGGQLLIYWNGGTYVSKYVRRGD